MRNIMPISERQSVHLDRNVEHSVRLPNNVFNFHSKRRSCIVMSVDLFYVSPRAVMRFSFLSHKRPTCHQYPYPQSRDIDECLNDIPLDSRPTG